jgi:hypothetical protein
VTTFLAEQPATAQPPAPPAAGGWRDALFPADQPGPGPRRLVAWLWALAAVVVGAGISLGRTGSGAGIFQTIWAEDGTYFYSDALGRPVLTTIVRPLQGYFVMYSRLLAAPTRLVPLEWGPPLLTTEAALSAGVLAVAVYAASRTHLRTVLGRLIAAAPIVAVPVGENFAATTANNVATLQFIGIYATMWMLFWRPARRWQQWAAFALVLTVALNTLLVVLVLPLALLRLFLVRDRLGQAMTGALVFGAGLNVLALKEGWTARPAFLVPHYDPLWAVQNLFTWALPNAVLGYRFNDGVTHVSKHHTAIVLTAVAILVIVVVAALRFASPQWRVAVVLGAQAAILVCGSVMSAGRLELRYVVAPELMLFAAMAILLRPAAGRRDWRAALPTAVLAAFVVAVCAFSYQMPSNRTVQRHPWSTLVAQARVVCRDPHYGAVYVYPVAQGAVVGIPAGKPIADSPPVNWPVRLPCDRLR